MRGGGDGLDEAVVERTPAPPQGKDTVRTVWVVAQHGRPTDEFLRGHRVGFAVEEVID
jgi:hypothetical protein